MAVEFMIGSNKMTGTLPASFEYCSSLQKLSLSANQFTGPLPEFSQLMGLLELNLASTDFHGPFPDAWQILSNLEVLNLSQMGSFSGKLPSTIGAMSSLKHLILTETHFFGEIPTSIGTLTSLRKSKLLHLCRRNQTNQPKLTTLSPSTVKLDAAFTFFQDQIPTEIGNLIDLCTYSRMPDTMCALNSTVLTYRAFQWNCRLHGLL
jgi:Leucine-rich repeat (LRR) protein